MNRIRPALATAVLSLAALGLAACSTTSPDVIQRGDAQRASTVQYATVVSVRPVTVEGSQSGLGGVAGGIVGGVAGSTIGGGKGAIIAGTLGAVAGGVAGNAAERYGTREQALEIVVRMPSGEDLAIVQAQGQDSFNPGDRVRIISSGSTTRVTR